MLNNELRQLLVIDQLCDVEQYEKCKTNGLIINGVYPHVFTIIDRIPSFIVGHINNRNARQIEHHPYYSTITIGSL